MGYSIDPQFNRKEAMRLLRLALSMDDIDPETLALVAIVSVFIGAAQIHEVSAIPIR